VKRSAAVNGTNFTLVVEDRRRNGAAEIDVETDPIALRIGHAEAGQRAIGAADKLATVLHRFEGLRKCRWRAECKHHCKCECRGDAFHDRPFQA
jgi:hypothetical protein